MQSLYTRDELHGIPVTDKERTCSLFLFYSKGYGKRIRRGLYKDLLGTRETKKVFNLVFPNPRKLSAKGRHLNIKLYFNMLPFLIFLLFGTTNACLSWEILAYYEAIGNFGKTSIELTDNGVRACSGDASDIGNNRLQANCIEGYSAYLDESVYPWQMGVSDNNGLWINTINCNVDVTTVSQLVSCYGDDGTC
jgi:hypothetical protein